MAVQLNPRGEVLNATRKSQILLELYCEHETWVHGGVQAIYNNNNCLSASSLTTYHQKFRQVLLLTYYLANKNRVGYTEIK